jgi:hypothetical protein
VREGAVGVPLDRDFGVDDSEELRNHLAARGAVAHWEAFERAARVERERIAGLEQPVADSLSSGRAKSVTAR